MTEEEAIQIVGRLQAHGIKLCPHWREHDGMAEPCKTCNDRAVVMGDDGSPVPDNIELTLASFVPDEAIEGDVPMTLMTIQHQEKPDENTQSQGQ